jgi:hypothetical protein
MSHLNLHPKVMPFTLFTFAGVLIVVSFYLVWRFGSAAYFAATGRPWHLLDARPKASPTVIVPTFTTSQAISSASPARGTDLTITITATASQTVKGQVQAWIISPGPAQKQIWRSSATAVTNFPAGKAVTTTYQAPLAASLKPGIYRVSLLINSTNTYSDYAVKEDFAEFTLQ